MIIIMILIGLLILSLWVIGIFIPRFVSNYLYLNKHQKNKQQENYIAIIVPGNPLDVILLINMPKLFRYLKKKKWPYRIYSEANRYKFREIIYNKRATIIYMFGHGARHHIAINKKELLHYCELKDAPKKKYVFQMHCNGSGGKSLEDYISNNKINSFITNKNISYWGINKFIKEITQGKHQKEGP